eukprot:gb/GFBE01021082.1/.p1 GENE.gb/GFBE01021082.1/~~gb/GFBE01021082.1/.p1  ORF type:complete len:295 (+),score=34.83 gb/GFBE01021082.1/:1-885(+)
MSRGRLEDPGSPSRSRLARSASKGILSPSEKDTRQGGRSKSPAALHRRGKHQSYHRPFEVAYRDIAEQRNFKRLEKLFTEADADGSGEMSLDEFRGALRKPWIQRSFSLLGVQPHQAEVVFKTMKKHNREELSIQDFMAGLETLVGSDLDGPPHDLDVQMLRPSYKAKEKLALANSRSLGSLMGTPDFSGSGPGIGAQQSSVSSWGGTSLMVSRPTRSTQQGGLSLDWNDMSSASFTLGDYSRPGSPQAAPNIGTFADTETFTHSATAKALHSATAERRQARRVGIGGIGVGPL